MCADVFEIDICHGEVAASDAYFFRGSSHSHSTCLSVRRLQIVISVCFTATLGCLLGACRKHEWFIYLRVSVATAAFLVFLGQLLRHSPEVDKKEDEVEKQDHEYTHEEDVDSCYTVHLVVEVGCDFRIYLCLIVSARN